MKKGLVIGSLVLCVTGALGAQEGLKTDVFPLKEGSLKITFIGHGTLMFDYNGMIIHVDPVGKEADFTNPVILPIGGTVEDAAVTLHKDFAHKLKYAKIWGHGKFDGQRVQRDFRLIDGDILEFHL